MNYLAPIAFWLFCTGMGYLISPGVYGAVAGLVVGVGTSLGATLLVSK